MTIGDLDPQALAESYANNDIQRWGDGALTRSDLASAYLAGFQKAEKAGLDIIRELADKIKDSIQTEGMNNAYVNW